MFFLIVFYFLIPRSDYSQFKKVAEFSEYSTGYSIDAVDNCCILSYIKGGVGVKYLKSTNSGNDWSELEIPLGEFEIAIDISVVDPLRYWIATSSGRIAATKDGGENWIIQFDDSTATQFMNYIEMFDLNNGIAMGDVENPDDLSNSPGPALILETTDGGSSWVSKNYDAFGGISGDTWRRIDFVNPQTGYFYHSGFETQKLHKTTDGCQTWENVYSSSGIIVLKFFDEQYGLAILFGQNGIRTSDGGKNWDMFTFNAENYCTDIEFTGNSFNKIWVGTLNGLFYSNDFAENWYNYSGLENIKVYDIKFIDEDNGWLLAGDGVYYIDNGSITEIQAENLEIKDFYLSQNYPNPFNPTTTIKYQIAKDGFVNLAVYNLLGERISTLLNEFKTKGIYNENFIASDLPNGVYFYKLSTRNFTSVKKMMLIK